jgi:type II secretory pathway predicted ATPase ExeA
MGNLQKLAELNGVAQLEGTKFFEDGNKSAGRRFRKALMGIKTLTHEMRKEVSETNND